MNPLLALRNASCNDRWDTTWAQIEQQLRQNAAERKRERRGHRAAVNRVESEAPPEVVVGEPPVEPPPARNQPAFSEPSESEPPPPAKPKADHPWRRAWSIRRQQELAQAA